MQVYKAQTVGIVQVSKATLEIDQKEYLCLLMTQLEWMIDQEDLETVKELVRPAEGLHGGGGDCFSPSGNGGGLSDRLPVPVGDNV